MTIAAAKKEITSSIAHLYEQREALTIAQLLIEKIMALPHLEQILQKNKLLNETAQQLFIQALQKLQKGEPIQYVIGEAWFSGYLFNVSSATLIPRPETEELVQWVVDDNANKKKQLSLLDIGTGTGCIPIAIAKKIKNITPIALDISQEALPIAQKNASTMGVNLQLMQVDFLHEHTWLSLPTVDIITSNPPYIAEREKASMHTNVLAYEPHVALFVPDNDPLIFYKAIAKFAKEKLQTDGIIYVELNEQLGEETKNLFSETHFNTELRKDMQGKNRILRAIKK
jgi:release factor glutamine methyltransferase